MKMGWRRWLPVLCIIAVAVGCDRQTGRELVVYSAQDQVFAEPIFNQFTRETGIRVRAVFDSEAVKTVGLANRLLAERNNPQCDVWWSNEELRTRQLEASGVFREPSAIGLFGSRSRRIVINTNKIDALAAPRSLTDLTNQQWRGKIAVAYPMFGTTSTHFLALRQQWGAEAWDRWCAALVANKAFIVEGNSVVVKLVGRGDAWIGLTDSDDIRAGQREGLPIAALPLGPDLLVIPNSAAIVRSTGKPAEAKRLFQFLQSKPVARALVEHGATESAAAPEGSFQITNWSQVLADLAPATARMKEIFLR